MQEFTFNSAVNSKHLDHYIGHPDFAIIYEITYLPYEGSNEHPYLYSGSSWGNSKDYLGSCLNRKYRNIWQEETKIYPERFRKKVLAAYDKTIITADQLRKIESDYQWKYDHAKDFRYFNSSNRCGGPGMSSEQAIQQRLDDPEKWKQIDKVSAAKAAETKRQWSDERKAAFGAKISKIHKGRKCTWNDELKDARALRPNKVYYKQYTFETPHDGMQVIKEWENMRQYLAEYNSDKHRDQKCGLERLIKEKEWRGFKLIEIRGVATEGKDDTIIYICT